MPFTTKRSVNEGVAFNTLSRRKPPQMWRISIEWVVLLGIIRPQASIQPALTPGLATGKRRR